MNKESWYKFPVGEDKAPLCKWREESKLEGKYKRTGIDCGKSHLVVIDIDPGGEEAWIELTKKHEINDHTYCVQTPRGGLHYYFNYAGDDIRNSAGKLAPHIDVRAAGGYVVAPPTPGYKHLSGEVIDLPKNLINLIHQAKPFFEDEVFVEGTRHNGLVSVAGKLWNTLADKDVLFGALKEVNKKRCNPPLSEEEVKLIAYSTKHWESDAKESPVEVREIPTFLSLAELRERPVKPLEWLVQSLIPAGTVGQDAGTGGTFKSYIFTELALHVATGTPWNGLKVQQCPVLIIDLENGLERVTRRAHEMKHLEQGPVFWKLKIRNKLDNPAFVDEILEYLELTKAKWVILDSMVDFLGELKESDNNDVALAISRLREIREASGATITFHHHTPKSSTGAKWQSGRGASSFKDNSDLSIQVMFYQKYIQWEHDKIRDSVVMRMHLLPRFEEGKFYTELIKLEPASAQSKDNTITILLNHFEEDWQPRKEIVERLQTTMGIKKSAAYAKVKYLIDEGFVEASPLEPNFVRKIQSITTKN